MKPNNVLVVYYVHNYRTLQLVESCLRSHRIKYRATRRAHLTGAMCKNRDLIMVVGGDGTFMKATHCTGATPILAVSSDIRYNEGFYAQATPKDFVKKFARLLKGKYKIRKLPRLEARINGTPVPYLAVNEVFVGNRHPVHTSRYTIQIGREKEFQKSSGVLITTHAGASGWARSAAKKPLKIPKESFGYVVREPYHGRLTKPKLVQGSLKKNEVVRIKSRIHHGIVAIDSSESPYKFIDGYKLEVRISKQPLNYIEF